jgi:hypothetical protein
MRRTVAFVVTVAALGCGAPSAPVSSSVPARVAARADVAARAASSAAPSASATPGEARDAAIKKRFGTSCRLARECQGLWGIDCDAALDGPYYYVEAQTLDVVARCGGYCDGARCTNCPPRTWTCSNP